MNASVTIIIRCLAFWSLLLLLFFLSGPITAMFPDTWPRFMYGAVGTISAFFLTWLFLKSEKRSIREIGLVWEPGTPWRFFAGLLIGTALFSVILLSLLLLTPLQIQFNPQPIKASALVGYLAFFPLSLMEEIGFRAYPFRRLNDRFGIRVTQLIIAIVFALYHVAGGQSVGGSFLGPGIYAFVFGLAAAWSGGIAVPFGIHVALNILQPLTGMRGASGAIWMLSHKESPSTGQTASPDTIGIIMQFTVLAIAILLTEYYIRKNADKAIKINS
jgi:membrane protease YdiL (CAAX protease family)